MNSLAALTLITLAASPGSIELALAERTGVNTARLTILKSDERLQALCLDLDGWSAEMIEQAQEQVTARPVWLYLGSRKIAQGRVGRFESAASPTSPCAVTAEARFDGYVPLTTRSDVLWATTRDLGSRPLRPLPRAVAERARVALADPSACVSPSAAIARAVEDGTFVSLSCGGTSSLVYVPAKGEPRRVPVDSQDGGAVTLLEVVERAQGGGNTLFLARDVEGGQRVEAWESDGRAARRIDAWIF
ncbi:MAG TPA: hypothetical protein VGK67_04760 [Myxococcales bacterium]|jgi:hypothetical protein